MLYVTATYGEYYRGDITGVEFRIEVTEPEGWVISYMAPEGSILIGDPIDRLPADSHDNSGANVAFPSCQRWDANGHIDLGRLYVRNEGGGPTELLVKRRSKPLNRLWPCALFTNCEDPTYWSTCNTPLLASSCTSLVEPADPNDAGGDCDRPYGIFALNREPDPRWTAPPRQQFVDREVLAMLTRRTLIELPEGEHEAPLDRAIVRSEPLRSVLERYAVEWVSEGIPCFDLADTIAVTDWGDTVRLTDWSLLWVFTLPTASSVEAFIGDLSALREVVYAEANGIAVPAETYGSSFYAANPIVQRGSLMVVAPRPMPGRVEVFDARGRRLKVLLDRPLTAGPNELFWDGTDDAGERVPSGVYFVHVTAGAQRSTHKLVYMR
jgi:hypothetical protein